MEEPTNKSTQRDGKLAHITSAKRELVLQYKFLAVFWAFATGYTATLRILESADAPLAKVVIAVQVCLAACSLLMLFRPAWTTTLFASSLIHVGYVIWTMPDINSTTLLWLLFSLPVITSFATGWTTRRSFDIGPVGMYRSVAPCIRIVAIFAIGATAVARINSVFLDPHQTPLRPLIEQIPYADSISPAAYYVAMSALIAIDFAIVVALTTSSLRRFAIGLGSVYFTGLALLGLGDARWQLPLLLMAFSLFASPNLTVQIATSLNQLTRFLQRRWIPIVIALGSIVGGIAASIRHLPEASKLPTIASVWVQDHPSLAATGLLMAVVSFWIALLLPSLIEGQPRRTKLKLLPRTPLNYVAVALTLLMVSSPYLGLGNRGRFVDRTGLTQAGYASHLLIPSVDLLELEGDRIEIRQSNNDYLQGLADSRKQMARLDFLRFFRSHPETTASILEDGELIEVSAGNVAELSTANHRICSKFITFSPTGREVVSTAGNN